MSQLPSTLLHGHAFPQPGLYINGWLLWVAAAIAVEAVAASASAVVPAVVVTMLLLLWGVVDVVGWRLLLSDGHAELLKPRQLCLDGS